MCERGRGGEGKEGKGDLIWMLGSHDWKSAVQEHLFVRGVEGMGKKASK